MDGILSDDIVPAPPGPGIPTQGDSITPAPPGPGQISPAGSVEAAPGGEVVIRPGPENIPPEAAVGLVLCTVV